MALIKSVAVSFVAKTKQFIANVSSSEKKLNRFQKSTMRTGKAMRNLDLIMKGFVAGSALQFGKRILQSADDLQAMSDRLGTTAKALQNLQFVATGSNVSIQTMNMALQRMTRRISEASQGTGEAVKALQELGLNADELSKLPLDEQFLKISRAFDDVTNSGDRVRLMMKLADSEGVGLLQTMRDGSKGVEDLLKQSREYNSFLTNEMIASIADFNTQLELMKTKFQNIAFWIAGKALKAMKLMNLTVEDMARSLGAINPLLAAFFAGSDAIASGGGTKHFEQDLVVTKRARDGGIINMPSKKLQSFFKKDPLFADDINGRNRGLLSAEKENAMRRRLEQLKENFDKVRKASEDMGNSFADAFTDFIQGAKSAEDAVKSLFMEIQNQVIERAVAQPLANYATGIFENIGQSIVSGGGMGNVFNMSINTPNANSFRQSSGQVVDEMSRAVSHRGIGR